MKQRIDPKLPIPQLSVSAPDPPLKIDGYQDRLLRRLNELFRLMDGGGVEVEDDGTDLGHADTLNFVDPLSATLNADVGTIDVTISGSTGDTMTAVADEDIAAGQFVALFNSSGTPKCRVARSSSGQGYQADGFCKAAFSSGATATIYLPGDVNVAGGTGLTAGDVWLGTDGYATNTAPTTAGYISQQIGVAESATNVAFEPDPDILIATASSVTYGGTSQAIVITSSGTLTIPTGVTAGRLTMQAPGGGGSTRTSALGGGGGGAGETLTDFPIAVTSGASYTVTMGAAGSGAASGGGAAAGTDGGDVSIVIGSLTLTVRGGKGGASGGNGGAGGGSLGGAAGATSGGAGGNGAFGGLESTNHFGGSSGGAGASTTATNGGTGGASGGMNTGAAGGTAGSSQAGGGGGGSTTRGTGGAGGAGGSAGSDATGYGAGGGGAGGLTGSNAAGGKGAPGLLIFEFIA